MKQHLSVLKSNILFKNIGESEIELLMRCLGARVTRYSKGQAILVAGDAPKSIGIVLSGAVRILREDFSGDNAFIREVQAGGSFNENYASAGVDHIPISVIAAEKCEVTFLPVQKIASMCTTACPFHIQMIQNLFSVLGQRAIRLSRENYVLSQRSIRKKLLAYLSQQRSGHTGEIRIPFSRAELATYLGVDRSALSRELCKMQEEGILRFHKNCFLISQPSVLESL